MDRSAPFSNGLVNKVNAAVRRLGVSPIGILVLSLAPLAIWLVPFLNREKIGPFYANLGRADPSYAYLLNSLAVTCGMSPRHVDHPGTPLQILGAIVIGAMKVLRGENPICPVPDVLTRPETYLAGMSTTLQISCAILAAIVSIRLYKITGNIFAAVAIQVCILISPGIAGALGVFGAEILLIPTVMAFGFTALPLVTGSRVERPHDSIVAGAILGFGLATKLTMFPLFLYVFLFESRRSKLKFLGAFFGSFLFWTSPIACTPIENW